MIFELLALGYASEKEKESKDLNKENERLRQENERLRLMRDYVIDFLEEHHNPHGTGDTAPLLCTTRIEAKKLYGMLRRDKAKELIND